MSALSLLVCTMRCSVLTDPRSYDTTWASTTGHVSTKTEVYLTTSTRTVTSPGATTYATTVSKPTTLTTVAITFSTITSTVWSQGCQTWACKL